MTRKVNFAKQAATEEVVAPAVEEVEVSTNPTDLKDCYVNPVTEGKNGLVAYVDMVFDNLMYRGIRIFEKTDENGKKVLRAQFANRKTNKQDEEGRDIYSPYYVPSKAAYEAFTSKAVNAYLVKIGNDVDMTEKKFEAPENTVNVYLAQENENNLVAFANVLFDGIHLNNIAIKTKKDDANSIYVQFPSKARQKNGEYVKDESGYTIRDEFYHPINSDKRTRLVNFILDEVEAAVSQA